MEEKTEWRGQSESQIVGEKKRSGRLVGAAETSKELAECRRVQRKNWTSEKKRVASVPQREQLASTPKPSLPKRKEQSRLS